MKTNEKLRNLHIFFVGIGGISMSGLAKLVLSFGNKVSGSDITKSNITKELENVGVNIFYKHHENNIDNDCNLVIYSGSIGKSNPEVVRAKELGIQCFERSEFLGLVCDMFKNVIAVSGTHGKTTTTALIGEILLAANLNPTIHVGGQVSGSYSNFRLGSKDWFITEACEYKRSLTYIKSSLAVITNLEADHMDCYDSLEDLVNTFIVFCRNSKKVITLNSNKNLLNSRYGNKELAITKKDAVPLEQHGINFLNEFAEDIEIPHFLRGIQKKDVACVLSASADNNIETEREFLSHNDVRNNDYSDRLLDASNVIEADAYEDSCLDVVVGANNVRDIEQTSNNLMVVGNKNGLHLKHVKLQKNGCYSFSVYDGKKLIHNFLLNIPGEYNVYNAFLAFCVAHEIGIEPSVVAQVFKNFKGIKRRNEHMGYYRGLPVIADYAHHPTELEVSIKNFNNIYKNPLIIFQPHTYSRTIMLKKEFTNCFKNAKMIVLYKTYPAREEPVEGSHALDMFNYIKHQNKHYAHTLAAIKRVVDSNIADYDSIIVLGAGDLYDDIANVFELDKE